LCSRAEVRRTVLQGSRMVWTATKRALQV